MSSAAAKSVPEPDFAREDEPVRLTPEEEERFDAMEAEAEEDERGQGCYAELPAPLHGAEVEEADEVVGEVREQDADDDVDLKHSYETAAQFCWG